MRTITTVSSTKFSLDGISFFKNYISDVAGEQITIFNCYDRKDVKVDYTHYSEITLNGVVYGNVADLQTALLPVIYTRASLAPSGGGVTEFTQLTDAPESYTGQGSKVVAVKADETGLEFVTGGGSKNLGQVLDNGDRDINPALDGDTLEELFAHKFLITCEQLTVDTDFVIPANYTDVDLVNGATVELKILNNSVHTITLSAGVDVVLVGSNLTIPQNAIACIKSLGDGITYSVTYQLNEVSGGGAVDSVNGQTGVVVLDSGDVGAEPTLGFTPENVSNKAPNLTSPDDTKYPTTLAVSNALAFKANAPLIDTVSSSALTGVTTEGILKSYLIEAGTYSASDILNFANDLYKTGTAGTVTSRLYTNTTASLSGASLLATNISTTGNRKIPLRRQLVLKDGNIEVLLATSSVPDDNVNSSSPATIVTFNPAIDNYFITTAQNASSGDSTLQNNFKLHY